VVYGEKTLRAWKTAVNPEELVAQWLLSCPIPSMGI